MTDKTFHLEIITPLRVVYNGTIRSCSAPGVTGGFQILYNHAPLLSSLDIGEVKIIETQGTELHYAVSGGFLEVRDNQVVLLADTAERTDEIDKLRAETARDRAKKLIIERSPNTDIERARFALNRALNRLKVAATSRN
jgi:F-type H+-transporting ATPase subunit epsilon